MVLSYMKSTKTCDSSHRFNESNRIGDLKEYLLCRRNNLRAWWLY